MVEVRSYPPPRQKDQTRFRPPFAALRVCIFPRIMVPNRGRSGRSSGGGLALFSPFFFRLEVSPLGLGLLRCESCNEKRRNMWICETTHFDRSYARCCHKPSQARLCRQAPVKSANPTRVQSSVRLCHRLFLRGELLARHPKIADYDIDVIYCLELSRSRFDQIN
jgi:hypothetical protein